MSALAVTQEWFRNLIATHHWTSGEIAIFVAAGGEKIVNGKDIWSLSLEFESSLDQFIPEGITYPTLFLDVGEPIPLTAGLLSIAVGGFCISFPLIDLDLIRVDVRELLATAASLEWDDENQGEVWEQLKPHAKRAIGWLSGVLSCTPDQSSFSWLTVYVDQEIDGEWSPRLLVFTSMDMEGLSSTFSWNSFWAISADIDEVYTQFKWQSPTIEVVERADGIVIFDVSDDEGSIRYRTNETFLSDIQQNISSLGFAYKEVRGGTTVTLIGGNNSISRNGQELRSRRSGRADQSVNAAGSVNVAPGAQTYSGIVHGDINVAGQCHIDGIINGDVNVPPGAAADIRGIVNGIIRVNGGIARLFGTAESAEITAGRLEIYGILQESVNQTGGEIYCHPDSIVG